MYSNDNNIENDNNDVKSSSNLNKEKKENLAKERAQRVKLLRSMTGLSRQIFAKKYGIPLGNFQNWEGPRYGGLTEKAANTLIEACRHEGIEVNIEWLMYGSNVPPAIMPPSYQAEAEGVITESAEAGYAIASVLSEEEQRLYMRHTELAKVAKELELFKKNYGDKVLITVIVDDAMEPCYRVGDYVAGNYSTDIKAFLNSECVVETTGKQLLVRILEAGSEENVYNLRNFNIDSKQPVLEDVKILKVAPIMWIRRFGGKFSVK